MKRTFALALSIITAASVVSVVNAKEFQVNPDGTLRYNVNDVILKKNGNSESIRLAGNPLIITDSEPDTGELKSEYITKYWVDCESPYLIYFDKINDKIIKENFELNISYIWDIAENKVYDYETNEELGVIINSSGYDYSKAEYFNLTDFLDRMYWDEEYEGWLAFFIQPEPNDIPSRIIGDLDFNGIVDITDLTRLSIALVDNTELPMVWKTTADVDGDGKVGLTDLATLKRYISKQIDLLG